IWWPLAVAAVPAAALAIFVLARHIRLSWLRIPIRLLSGIAMPIGALLLLLFLLLEISCTARPPNTWSPDGRHVAVLTYGLRGALGADSAWITLRRRWS